MIETMQLCYVNVIIAGTVSYHWVTENRGAFLDRSLRESSRADYRRLLLAIHITSLGSLRSDCLYAGL
jgi:hypothetical protein